MTDSCLGSAHAMNLWRPDANRRIALRALSILAAIGCATGMGSGGRWPLHLATGQLSRKSRCELQTNLREQGLKTLNKTKK